MAAPARIARLRSRKEEPRPTPDAMTLGEHLGELRRRLIIAIATIAVGAIACYVLYNRILNFLREPYCKASAVIDRAHHVHLACPNFYVTTPLQGFSLRLDVAGLRRDPDRAAGPALPALAFRHARPQSEREALRVPVHGGDGSPVRARRHRCLPDVSARARFPDQRERSGHHARSSRRTRTSS